MRTCVLRPSEDIAIPLCDPELPPELPPGVTDEARGSRAVAAAGRRSAEEMESAARSSTVSASLFAAHAPPRGVASTIRWLERAPRADMVRRIGDLPRVPLLFILVPT